MPYDEDIIYESEPFIGGWGVEIHFIIRILVLIDHSINSANSPEIREPIEILLLSKVK